jgi:hypothetical protein
VITSTLPGARLFHEGQFDGRKVRLPVFLGRSPEDSIDPGLHEFYAKLLKAIDRPVFRAGQWLLCDRTGWPNNASFQLFQRQLVRSVQLRLTGHIPERALGRRGQLQLHLVHEYGGYCLHPKPVGPRCPPSHALEQLVL